MSRFQLILPGVTSLVTLAPKSFSDHSLKLIV